jgi:epoxide hydrolase 4
MHPDAFDHRYAQINGIRMHYVQAGSGEQLVVLLHGFPECWYSWRHQIPLLAEQFTVVAPDMRGYNETEKPRHGYELDVLVADIAALIKHLGREKAIVIGHDWGGAIAWAIAIARPELVERLVVMNVPHLGQFGPGKGLSPRQMLRSWYMVFFQIPWLPEALMRATDHRFVRDSLRRDIRNSKQKISDDEIRFFTQAIARPGALTAAINYYRRGLLHTGGIFKGTGLRVAAPTMLIWGEEDAYLGKELVRGTERFVPNLQVRFIPNCSHWVQQDQPEIVNAYLHSFLMEVPHG